MSVKDLELTTEQAFTGFVHETEPRLSFALAAAYGPEVGADVTAEALEWAWEHWDEVREMSNAAGYLYRVGQSRARWYHRSPVLFPKVYPSGDLDLAIGLPEVLATLTKNQRVCVVLIHAFGFSEREVADMLGISRRSVRTHAERGLKRLRSVLEVNAHA